MLSLTTAGQAGSALRHALPGRSAKAVYADANTAAAGLKQRHPGRAGKAGVSPGKAGVSFADVAIMAPVPGRGLRTPMVASGPGAEATSPGRPGQPGLARRPGPPRLTRTLSESGQPALPRIRPGQLPEAAAWAARAWM